MKTIFKLFLKPTSTIKKVAADEPLFQSVAIFIVSVLVGNFGLVSNFFISPRAAIFNSFALVAIWFAALILADLMTLCVIRFLHPAPSKNLYAERFRKFLIVQMYVSAILIFRPIISLFAPVSLAWELMFIWGETLLLIALVNIWETEEIKAAIAIGAGAVLVFLGGHLLKPREPAVCTEEFKEFSTAIESVSAPAFINIFEPVPEPGSYNKNDIFELLKWFSLEKHPPLSLYARAAQARLCVISGEEEEGAKIYSDFLKKKEISPLLYRTIKFSLKGLLGDEDYALLPGICDAADWHPILSFWNIPQTFSDSGSEAGWMSVLYDIIQKRDMDEIRPRVDKFIQNYSTQDYADDENYWMGLRMSKEKNLEAALDYFGAALEASYPVTKERWEKEGLLKYSDMLLGGINILQEEYRVPSSLLAMGGIMLSSGDISGAEKKFLRLNFKFPGHWSAGAGLSFAATCAEISGEFRRAKRIYRKIISGYSGTLFERRASLMLEILQDSSLEELEHYCLILKEYHTGDRESLFVKIQEFTNLYPDSPLAYELAIALSGIDTVDKDNLILSLKAAALHHPYGNRRVSAGLRASDLISSMEGARAGADYLFNLAKTLSETDGASKENFPDAYSLAEVAAIRYLESENYSLLFDVNSFIIDDSPSKYTQERAGFLSAYVQELANRNYDRALESYSALTSEASGKFWGWRAAERIKSLSKD